MMRRPARARSLVRTILGPVGASLLVGCSLGEGITPACDPDAGPGASGSCAQLAECDDGTGKVKATEQCCLPVGNLAYGKCDKHALADDADFRTLCTAGGDACCNDAQEAFDLCLEGTSTTTSSSSTSTGGSGGGGAGAGGPAGGGGG
jgi:hypothetical protein